MPKVDTSSPADIKPYKRPSSPSSSEKAKSKSLKQTKIDLPRIKSSVIENEPKVKKGEYDKSLLVILVLKTAKDIKWDLLGQKTDKTATQCKEVWRKVILPALSTNKSWANEGKGWTKSMKIELFMTVLESCKPNWEDMTASFQGKTKSQIHDVWRKMVLPKLKRGETVW
ncbi:uncharacterized protein IL334_004018 [Kwoniella shivajii]|uniref:Myb-like domain-containing protein n=1 Tax=Kwoniella shivajii TaxID=564305 RepID=A0ABZ1D0F8_9TREE|nr:hypothetical protein IL334_004018 [Kwoniella shivajii]